MFDYRAPDVLDSPAIRSIAVQDNGAYNNSTGYYLTFFRDFPRTSLVATDGKRPIGFVIGYRRPAEPGDYVIAQHALLPDFDTIEARTSLLTVAIRGQVHAGARRVELAVPDRDRTTLAALERVAEEQNTRVETAGRPATTAGPPDCSLFLLGPFTPAAN